MLSPPNHVPLAPLGQPVSTAPHKFLLLLVSSAKGGDGQHAVRDHGDVTHLAPHDEPQQVGRAVAWDVTTLNDHC